MDFQNAIYVDGTNSTIKVDVDGVTMFVPVDSANRHYADMVDQSIVISPAA